MASLGATAAPLLPGWWTTCPPVAIFRLEDFFLLSCGSIFGTLRALNPLASLGAYAAGTLILPTPLSTSLPVEPSSEILETV